MSDTYSIVCHETKQALWIGQGRGSMSCFYSGEPETMQRLGLFLKATMGKALVVMNDHETHNLDYAEFDGKS
jgi:hypothetical protein